MKSVYLVQHVHLLKEDEEDVKIIGIYSTKELAREAVERTKLFQGFCDAPKGFYIDEYPLDKDSWTEGYITVFD